MHFWESLAADEGSLPRVLSGGVQHLPHTDGRQEQRTGQARAWGLFVGVGPFDKPCQSFRQVPAIIVPGRSATYMLRLLCIYICIPSVYPCMLRLLCRYPVSIYTM